MFLNVKTVEHKQIHKFDLAHYQNKELKPYGDLEKIGEVHGPGNIAVLSVGSADPELLVLGVLRDKAAGILTAH